MDSEPRPTSLDPQQLGFTPRPPVAWLSPRQLAGTAMRVILSEQFGAYLDKRELQNALPGDVYHTHAGTPELWFDYVADLGDGFDATYSVAYLLGQPSLDLAGAPRPRGRLLIMGGDEVYPTASTQRYEDQTKGPYQAALPAPPPGAEAPDLFALPGNHDWYDGLTAFLRLFVKNGRDNIGGWRNAQARSYFAIELPHRWWLLAIDTQFSAYLDDPQMAYFRAAAASMHPGDNVILCTPSPGWVESVRDPGAYDTIDYFVRKVVEPTGAAVRLMLSGDLHHYAHYQPATPGTGPDRHLITCGGGGAYLYPTHRLPPQIDAPPAASLVRKSTPSHRYALGATFPTRADSAGYAAGVFTRLPRRNKGFVGLLGTLQALFMLAALSLFQHAQGNDQRLFSIPAALMGTVILLATTFFAMPPTAGQTTARHWLLGVGHGCVQLGLGIAGTFAWNHTPFAHLPWPLPPLAAVIYLVVSGLAATEVVCLYLLVASAFGVNLNELFAGQGIDDAKCFLRLRLTAEGLTIYPVAVPRVGRRWRAAPVAPASAPWIEPVSPIGYELAEPAIMIPARPATTPYPGPRHAHSADQPSYRSE